MLIAIIIVVIVILIALFIKTITTRRRLYKRAQFLASEYPHAFDDEYGTVDFIFKNNNKTLHILLEDYSTEPRLKRIEQEKLEKLRKEEEERQKKQRKSESIKSCFPAGFATFKKYNRSVSVEIIIQNEDLIRKYDEYHDIISKKQNWSSSQESFITVSDTQHSALIAGWLKDVVSINLPSISDRGEKEALAFNIPCHYFHHFCRDNSLDYSSDSLAGNYANDIIKLENKRGTFKDTLYGPLIPFIQSLPGPTGVVFSDSGQGTSAGSFNEYHFKFIRTQLTDKHIPFWSIDDTAAFFGKGIKSIVILDVTATVEDIKESSRIVLNLLQSKQPCITHISVLREISKEQMLVLLERKRIEMIIAG